jgi:NAD(P)-dependent dehydrogenase (short-subunit alcohol dehydrogenase family)
MDSLPVAIVTGAGSGIGRAICEVLAAAGRRIALVGRREAALEETMAGIAARSVTAPEMLLLPADLSDARQARSVVDLTLAQWGRVDAVVNNAGVAPRAAIDETDEDLVYETFAVNTFGPAHVIARAWPAFVRRRTGCVVNVSSLASSEPFPGFFVYGATKSALESLVRSVAREGAEHGVVAWNVAPGAVEAPALRKLFSEREIPRERALDPFDVARIVADCVLGRRPEPSGSTIRVVRE